MDSESSYCYSWFVHLKEAANRRWECLREKMSRVFSGNTRFLEDKNSQSIGRQTGRLKLSRRNKRQNRWKDGYVPYLPSPEVITPSYFSIWCAFFPPSLDIIKPVMTGTYADFSIWCAFFPDTSDVVRATQLMPVLPKTRKPACLASCTSMFPTLPSAVRMFFNMLSFSSTVALDPFYREQQLLKILASVIAPKAISVDCIISPNEVTKTSAVVPYSRPIKFPREITPSLMLTSLVPPLEAEFDAYMYLAEQMLKPADRSMLYQASAPFTARSSGHISTAGLVFMSVPEFSVVVDDSLSLMYKTRSMPIFVERLSMKVPLLVVLASLPSFASLINPARSSSPCRIQNASGSILPSMYINLTLLPTPSSVYFSWPKIIEIFRMLCKARLVYEQIITLAMSRVKCVVISLMPSTVLPCEAESMALTSATRPVLTTPVRAKEIGSLIIEGHLKCVDAATANMILPVMSLFGALLKLPSSSTVEKMTNELSQCCHETHHVYAPANLHGLMSESEPCDRLQLLAAFEHPNNSEENNSIANAYELGVESSSSEKMIADDAADDTCLISPFSKSSADSGVSDSDSGCSIASQSDLVAILTRLQKGYDQETFQIFQQNENKYKVDPCFMEHQMNINADMRSKVISWMAEIADVVEISKHSLFLAVNFMDRFLSHCSITKNNLQLVAVTCMFIAGKIETRDDPDSADDYVYLTAHTYTVDEILTLEKRILKLLLFNLHVPTTAWFCKELLNVCDADDTLENMTMYLAETTMLDVSYINVRPSILAAACLCKARHNLGLPVWSVDLWKRSSFIPDDFLSYVKCITETCAFYRNTEDQMKQGILKKYSAKIYQEIADIAKYPENDFESLIEKCREFVDTEVFFSPQRSASIEYRYYLFSGQDTPMTYDPYAKTFPLYERQSFKGYNVETYKIMLESERKYRADPTYMSRQTCVNAKQRQVLVEWMVHMTDIGNYPTSSLLLAVNLMDRVLSCCTVNIEALRLVALASLAIVTKFEVRCTGTINMFIGASNNAFSRQQLIDMEKMVLKIIDFKLAVPTAAWFCEELLDVCDADNTLRALTRYLVELTTLELSYLDYLPSQIAAAALCIARYSLGLPPWTKNLLERSAYELEDFLSCLRTLYKHYKQYQNQEGKLQFKYRKPQHMEVADFTKFPVPDIFRFLELYFREMDQP